MTILLLLAAFIGLATASAKASGIRQTTIEGGMKAVEKLRGALKPYANELGLPVEFLMAWIRVESGGNIKSFTNLGERGYFQLMPGKGHEGEKLGLGTDTNDPRFVRLGTDSLYSIMMGVRMVAMKMNAAMIMMKKNGVKFEGDDFLKLVKLQHGGSGFAQDAFKVVSESLGRPPLNWNEYLTETVRLSNTSPERFRFKASTTARVVRNAQRVGAIMNQLRRSDGKIGRI